MKMVTSYYLEDIPKFMRLLCLELEKSQWSVMLISSIPIKGSAESIYKLTVNVKPL